MNFDEMIESVNQCEFQEVRSTAGHYFEAVVSEDNLKRLEEVLKKYFGPPFKPASKAPSNEILDYTEPYGGIYEGQTFYFLEHDDTFDGAMIWPWNNGSSTTVKIFQEQPIP